MEPEDARGDVISALEEFRAGELGLAEARDRFSRLRAKLSKSEGLPARDFLLSVVESTIEGLGSIGLGTRFFDYTLDLLEDRSLLLSPPPPVHLKDAFGKQPPPCSELFLAECESCARKFPVAVYADEACIEGACGLCGRLIFVAADDPVRMRLDERAYREFGEPEERIPREKGRLIRELVRKYNKSAGTDPDGPLDVPPEVEKEYVKELNSRLEELREQIGDGWRNVRVQRDLMRELSESVGKCLCGGDYLFSPPPPDDDWEHPVCPFCCARARDLEPVSRYRYCDEHGWSSFDRRRI